jgi:hypothetical protein
MNYRTIDSDRPITQRTLPNKSYNKSKLNHDSKIMDQINIMKLSIIGNSKIENKPTNTKLKSSYISETTRNKINQLFNMAATTIGSVSPIRTTNKQINKQNKIKIESNLLKRNDFKDHIKNIEVIKRMQRRLTKDN